MAEKKKMVQTTVRLDSDDLREAQYYWSLEGRTLKEFVAEKVAEFIQDYRRKHPDRAPRGTDV